SNLTTPLGLRRQVLREYRRTQGLENEAIEFLVAGYILRAEARRGAIWYELAHDRLVNPGKVKNKIGRQQKLQVFQLLATQWNKRDRPTELLARANVLAEGERLHATGRLNSLEEKYLAASRAERVHRNEERRPRTQFPSRNLTEVGWGVVFA